MRLADYVVSYSLEINNRCLRYLAECDARGAAVARQETGDLLAAETHTVYAESLLARDSRRLVSLWSLMQPAWKHGEVRIADHVRALSAGSDALTDSANSRRLALRLASLAQQDHEAQAMLKLARKLPTDIPMTWDALNELFAQDSHFWRRSNTFRQLDDELVHERIARSYRKSYRLAALLPPDEPGPWLLGHGANLRRWVELCAHQLELLRPGLSDKGRAQLWYLDKMADTLRTREGLAAMRRAAAEVKIKKAAAKIVGGYIDKQIGKMDKRVVRLAAGCFSSKPKKMNTVIQSAANELGLRSVSLMKTAQEGLAQTPTPSTSTENVYG